MYRTPSVTRWYLKIGSGLGTFVCVAVIALVLLAIGGCKKTIHEAVQAGEMKTVEALIAAGADVNAVDSDGYAPLHVAAFSGQRSGTRLLLDAGAEIEAKDTYGYTALHLAARTSFLGTRVGQFLISRGADILATGPNGVSVLHLAAEGGDPNLIGLLVERGADVNAADDNGCTPLHSVLQGRTHRLQKEAVEALLAAGADVLIADKMAHNAIDKAVLRDRAELAVLMVETVNLNALDDSGNTLLHRAIRYHRLGTVKFLVEHGADVNALDARGYTPLDAANYVREKEIVEFLASKWARSRK